MVAERLVLHVLPDAQFGIDGHPVDGGEERERPVGLIPGERPGRGAAPFGGFPPGRGTLDRAGAGSVPPSGTGM